LVLIAWLTEVNLLWAAHQVHHSSDDYNFTTALRQSIFLKFFSWVSDIHHVVLLPLSDLVPSDVTMELMLTCRLPTKMLILQHQRQKE